MALAFLPKGAWILYLTSYKPYKSFPILSKGMIIFKTWAHQTVKSNTSTIMAHRAILGRFVTASIATIIAGGGLYGFMVNRKIRGISRNQFVASNDISSSLRNSRTVRELINIKNHQSIVNSLTIELEIPPQHEDVADEVLLASFTRGFFGGLVLAPERTLLQTLRLNLVRFTRMFKNPTVGTGTNLWLGLASWPPSTHIWSRAELPEERLPPMHSILFGVFQVVDVQLRHTDKGATAGHNESYVDFGWGSDQANFDGVHRFSVIRPINDPLSNRKIVQIHLQCLACNPQVDRPMGPGFLVPFHNKYSELLFREGVAEILKTLC